MKLTVSGSLDDGALTLIFLTEVFFNSILCTKEEAHFWPDLLSLLYCKLFYLGY